MDYRHASSRVTWLAIIAALLLLPGCADSAKATAHLAGRITIKGAELPADAEGYIQFMTTGPGQAPPSSTKVIGGRYHAGDVPLGSVNVIFNITRLTGRMVREDNAPGATPYPERENLVPAKQRAGMLIQVEGDDDAMDFNL